ncbi:MAG: response regulator [Candidatus Omnitrophota bacterium]
MIKILFVEDEPDIVYFMVNFLKEKGYEAIPATSGKEALKLLQEDRFNLAIIDLILPDMNGNDLCAMIRHDKKTKQLPIIISTGIGDSFTQGISKDLGVNQFLNKPYTAENLCLAIENCLGTQKER